MPPASETGFFNSTVWIGFRVTSCRTGRTCSILLPPAAATGCFQAYPVPALRRETGLAGELPLLTPACERIPALRARLPAVQRPGRIVPPLRHKGNGGVAQEFDLPDDAVAAAMLSPAPAASPYGVAAHPERICVFERFNRGVQGVGEMGVDGVFPIAPGASAHAAARCLVVGVWAALPGACAVVHAPDGEVVHRAA